MILLSMSLKSTVFEQFAIEAAIGANAKASPIGRLWDLLLAGFHNCVRFHDVCGQGIDDQRFSTTFTLHVPCCLHSPASHRSHSRPMGDALAWAPMAAFIANCSKTVDF